MADLQSATTIGIAEELLMNGYLRSINHSSFDIPPLIYKLCVLYRLGSAQYLWTVDPSTLQQMKNCANETMFFSPIFEIEGLLWKIKICPNGDSEENDGSFDVFLESESMPSSWKHIECCISTECFETMAKNIMFTSFTTKEVFGWAKDAMLHSEIQTLDSLSISIGVAIHRIVLKEDGRVFYERKVVPKNHSVQWRISPKMLQKLKTGHIGKQLCSPIYGKMYSVHLWRNNESDWALIVSLCALPKKKGTIDLSWTFEIDAKGQDFEKVDTQSIQTSLETINNEGNSLGWIYKIISVDDVLKCDSLVLKINMNVGREDNAQHQKAIDYWSRFAKRQQHDIDERKRDVNDSVVPSEENSFSKQSHLESLESGMESMKCQTAQILSVVNKVREDMQILKATIRNREYDNREQTENLELQQWMESEVKLPQYIELLMENGFEDMESMKDITMEHLRGMGINKIRHRLKLMKSVAALQAKNDP